MDDQPKRNHILSPEQLRRMRQADRHWRALKDQHDRMTTPHRPEAAKRSLKWPKGRIGRTA